VYIYKYMPVRLCRSFSVGESLMSFGDPYIPPGFHEFYDKYVLFIPRMLSKGYQSSGDNFMEFDGMMTREKLCKVWIKHGGMKHTATFLWVTRSKTARDSMGGIFIPEGALEILCIRVSPQPIRVPKILSVCIKKLVDENMPLLSRKNSSNVALKAEDMSLIIHWNKDSTTALVVEHSSMDFKVIKYSCEYTDLPKTLAGHCSMSSCDKWVLETGNHFYFLNKDRASYAMRDGCKILQGDLCIKQEEAREAALFEAFITGTHRRLGEKSVLLKYLSECAMPLHVVFVKGHI
jgi:hypothetical protein